MLKFTQYRSELTIAEGLIFKSQSLVIPRSMRNEMLNRVHYTHLEINKCIKLVQKSIFYQAMTNQIKQNIINCPLYLKYAKGTK